MNDTNESFAREHAAVWALIPWCVNGTASPEDLARARRHLQGCADCRGEWSLNERMQSALRPAANETVPDAVPDAQAALQRLLARIDAAAAQQPSAAGAAPSRWMRVLAVAAVVQAVGLSILLAAWWTRDTDGRYETLSSGAPSALPASATTPSAADIVVQLAPHTTLAELHALVQRSGMRLVSLDAGSVQLALGSGAAATPAQAAQRLHAEPLVLDVRLLAGPR